MRRWARRAETWWRRLRRRSCFCTARVVQSMDDVPLRPGATLYIVARDDQPRWVVIECPCRCGDRLEVNLMRSRQPCWRLRESGSRVTLSPSIWRSNGTCGSHFFIEKNKARWV
jgi:hypothetical protein